MNGLPCLYQHPNLNNQVKGGSWICYSCMNLEKAAWEEPRTRVHFDCDLGGPLLDNRPVKAVDCGNVTTDKFDPYEHDWR